MSKKPYKTARRVQALSKIGDMVGRTELAMILEATGEPAMLAVAQRLTNSAWARKSVGSICVESNVTFKQVVEAYRDFQRGTGIIEVSRRLPDVMQGIVDDALGKEVDCETCGTVGKIKIDGEEISCGECKGKGRKHIAPSVEARNQVLKMMDLTGTKTPMVAIQNNNVSSQDGYEDTLRLFRGGNRGALPDRTE